MRTQSLLSEGFYFSECDSHQLLSTHLLQEGGLLFPVGAHTVTQASNESVWTGTEETINWGSLRFQCVSQNSSDWFVFQSSFASICINAAPGRTCHFPEWAETRPLAPALWDSAPKSRYHLSKAQWTQARGQRPPPGHMSELGVPWFQPFKDIPSRPTVRSFFLWIPFTCPSPQSLSSHSQDSELFCLLESIGLRVPSSLWEYMCSKPGEHWCIRTPVTRPGRMLGARGHHWIGTGTALIGKKPQQYSAEYCRTMHATASPIQPPATGQDGNQSADKNLERVNCHTVTIENVG